MTGQQKVPLTYYTDPRDVAGLVADNGVDISDALYVSQMIEGLCDLIDQLERELANK